MRRKNASVVTVWRRCNGFTLLELLIALSLVSLIMMLLYGGLNLGSRNWDSIEQKVRETEDVRLARGFLQRALLQARKKSWEFEKRMYPVFFGGTEQLEFITPLSSHVGLPGLYVVRITKVSVEDRKDLVLQLGYSHEVRHPIPDGITVKCERPTAITISGADKQRVGQMAAEVRAYRKPEPFKGKGVKYADESILRKEGKKK